MAAMWGKNTLGPGSSQGWYFKRPAKAGLLPYISIYPLGLDDVWEPGQWSLTTGGYPYWNQLGISTQWCAFAPGEQALNYFIVVQNNSEYPLQYAFVEADF
jgi:hypothetical protein